MEAYKPMSDMDGVSSVHQELVPIGHTNLIDTLFGQENNLLANSEEAKIHPLSKLMQLRYPHRYPGDLADKPVIERGLTGRVKWYNIPHRFGFIIRDDFPYSDVYVHQTAIAKSNIPKYYLRTLDNGEEVEFDLVQGFKGYEAANVTGRGGSNVRGALYKYYTPNYWTDTGGCGIELRAQSDDGMLKIESMKDDANQDNIEKGQAKVNSKKVAEEEIPGEVTSGKDFFEIAMGLRNRERLAKGDYRKRTISDCNHSETESIVEGSIKKEEELAKNDVMGIILMSTLAMQTMAQTQERLNTRLVIVFSLAFFLGFIVYLMNLPRFSAGS